MIPQPKLKKRGLILLLLSISMIAPLSIDMYLPAFPTIVQDLNTNSGILNYTLMGFFIFFAIGTLFLGPISDKYGRKRTLLVGITAYGLTSFACSISPSVEFLIFFRILQALGAGCMVSVSTAIVKDSFDNDERPKIIATIQMLSIVAPTLAPIMGALILRFFDWRATFDVLMVLAIIVFIITVNFKETLPEENRIKGSPLASLVPLVSIFKNKPFMMLLTTAGVGFMIYMAFISVSSYIYINYFHLSETEYSIYFAINSALLMTGPYMYVKTRKIFTPKKLVYIGLLGCLSGGLLILTLGTISPVLFLITFLPITFCNSYVRSFATNILLGQKSLNAGASSSVINFTYIAMGAFGMALGGLPWPSFVVGVGSIAILASTMGLLIWTFFLRKKMKLDGL